MIFWMQERKKNKSGPQTPEAESLRDAYAALNRGDIDGFMKIFDPEILRVEFEGSPRAGIFQGFDEVREHVIRGRSTWAEGGCEPQRYIVAGDKVIVAVHVSVRLKGEADWLEGDVADGFLFRDGKVIEFRTFADESEALRWAQS